MRHQNALNGMWTGYINNFADGRIVPQLQQLAAAVGTAASGDARFKAYAALLLGFLNFVTQVSDVKEGRRRACICAVGPKVGFVFLHKLRSRVYSHGIIGTAVISYGALGHLG